MILFVADDHYGTHAGRCIYNAIGSRYEMAFFENDWTGFTTYNLVQACDLLVLHMIAGTCDNPLPDAAVERQVRAYCETGGNLLLLHGASAAFWHWEWWRHIVGLRWVRKHDPDGAPPSTHPTRPYTVTVVEDAHPLCAALQPLELPADELYINLQQVCPVTVLMETDTDEGTFPQCYLSSTLWGGTVAAFIPGHDSAVVTRPDLIANIKALIDHTTTPR